MMSIHSTAIVHRDAVIDETAEIGPYAVIDGAVRIGPNVRVYPHAYITGWTKIGAGSEIHPGAIVGHAPQDVAYTGAETYCKIGEKTIIREGASIHRGTDAGSTTVVGNRCFIMAGAHVAHNCVVEDDVTMVNTAALAGHVHVGQRAFIGGGAGIHQFVRIGSLAMIAGHAAQSMDAPPFLLLDVKGRCVGVNSVGMRRAGLTREQRQDVKRAYRILYRSGRPFREAVEALADEVATDAGRNLLEFLRQPSRRGIAAGHRSRGGVGRALPDAIV